MNDGDEMPAFIGDDVIHRCPSWLNTSSDIFNHGDRERMDDGVEEPTEMGVEVIHR